MLSFARSLARICSYFSTALLVMAITVGLIIAFGLYSPPKPKGNCYDPPHDCQ
jgi:hypothetical protein